MKPGTRLLAIVAGTIAGMTGMPGLARESSGDFRAHQHCRQVGAHLPETPEFIQGVPV